MKKYKFLLISLLFISCFKEPKKDVIIIEDTNVINTLQEPTEKDSIVSKRKIAAAEISITILNKILDMNQSEFNNWCIKQNYKFDTIENHSIFNTISYKDDNEDIISINVPIKEGCKPSVRLMTYNETEYRKLIEDVEKSNYNLDYKFSKRISYLNESNKVSFQEVKHINGKTFVIIMIKK